MQVLREQDFDKMAAHVVDQFLSGKVPLAQAAAKQAMDSGLNPDQIERLAQSANTMTFLRLMEKNKQANAGELTEEFDPIDSRQVIKIVIDSTGVHITPPPGMKVEHDGPDAHELPDEMAAERAPVDPEDAILAKEPGKDEPKEEKKETPKEAGQRLMRMRKLAGILEDQYKQAEWSFEDVSKQLTDRFRRLYQDVSFDDFEKDALAECGGDDVGIQVLNAIRAERKLPALDVQESFNKHASLRDTHVSSETQELALFETLVKIAREAEKLQRGVELVRARCV